MADASTLRGRHDARETADAAVASGEIQQMRDGRAAVYKGLNAAASGDPCAWETEGVFVVTKTASIVILDGGPVYWDHSANKAHFKPVNDRDFFLGTAVGDAASADTTMKVNLNVRPQYLLDLARDPFTTAAVGTAAAGGFGRPYRMGGANKFLLTATNEAQKIDALSQYGFAPGANAIIEMEINNVSNGTGGSQDFNIGIADGTHATDADTIGQSAFIHVDGNSTNINAECDDGTNETAATDTTTDLTAGTPFECWIDCRDLSSLKFYVNGVRVLSGTTFSIAAATGTLKLLVHLEKTSGTDTFEVDVNFLRARIAER